jgi:hypothetical protein
VAGPNGSAPTKFKTRDGSAAQSDRHVFERYTSSALAKLLPAPYLQPFRLCLHGGGFDHAAPSTPLPDFSPILCQHSAGGGRYETVIRPSVVLIVSQVKLRRPSSLRLFPSPGKEKTAPFLVPVFVYSSFVTWRGTFLSLSLAVPTNMFALIPAQCLDFWVSQATSFP